MAVSSPILWCSICLFIIPPWLLERTATISADHWWTYQETCGKKSSLLSFWFPSPSVLRRSLCGRSRIGSIENFPGLYTSMFRGALRVVNNIEDMRYLKSSRTWVIGDLWLTPAGISCSNQVRLLLPGGLYHSVWPRWRPLWGARVLLDISTHSSRIAGDDCGHIFCPTWTQNFYHHYCS